MVCFTCRTSSSSSFSGWHYSKATDLYYQPKTCTICGSVVVQMGVDFKAPKKNNIKQWRKVWLLHQRGYSFYRGSKIPKSLGQVKLRPSRAQKTHTTWEYNSERRRMEEVMRKYGIITKGY